MTWHKQDVTGTDWGGQFVGSPGRGAQRPAAIHRSWYAAHAGCPIVLTTSSGQQRWQGPGASTGAEWLNLDESEFELPKDWEKTNGVPSEGGFLRQKANLTKRWRPPSSSQAAGSSLLRDPCGHSLRKVQGAQSPRTEPSYGRPTASTSISVRRSLAEPKGNDRQWTKLELDETKIEWSEVREADDLGLVGRLITLKNNHPTETEYSFLELGGRKARRSALAGGRS